MKAYSGDSKAKKSWRRFFKQMFLAIVPKGMISVFRGWLGGSSAKRKALLAREFERLTKIPRFQNGYTLILGKSLRFSDAPSFVFMFKEIFEKEIYKFQTKVVKPYIIDAGANIGLSVIYFKMLFPEARIVAFEPDAKVCTVLKENISSFGFNDVQVVNKALWNEEGSLKFLSEGADAGRIATSTEGDTLIEVSTTRLSTYLGNKVDFLKIDIEGAETAVLESCKELLGRVERIFVEFHSFQDRVQTLDIVLSILKNAGFRCYISHIGVESPHPFCQLNNYLGMDNQLNIFGIRLGVKGGCK